MSCTPTPGRSRPAKILSNFNKINISYFSYPQVEVHLHREHAILLSGDKNWTFECGEFRTFPLGANSHQEFTYSVSALNINAVLSFADSGVWEKLE